MPYYLVGIKGDPHLAAGLLAKAGIQNVSAKDANVGGHIAARVSAASAELAAERVRQADSRSPATAPLPEARGATAE